ncbi:unnamed protein product [Moneuplotes crassus]|uniref:BZIP domain-containing protein n=1 Tax=Euplotes crassus TaxID=5936 RepID=A0AAD1XIW4_EUPCR|nr:unnamed protein product [Moneuplotes crassus]
MEIKDTNSNSSCSKPNAERKSGKLRSKEYRKRRKEYIENIEQKVEGLEQEIKDLKKENLMLKEKIGTITKNSGFQRVHRPEHPLIETQSYMKNTFMKNLRKEPDSVTLSMYHQYSDQYKEWSDNRRNYIKEQFDKIINEVVPFETKCYQALFRSITLKDLLKNQDAKRRHKKFFDKAFESPKDILWKIRFSDTFKKKTREFGSNFIKLLKRYQSIVKGIVIQRNKLLNIYSEVDKMHEGSDCYLSSSKEDIANSGIMNEAFEENGFLKPQFLWNLPTKKAKHTPYQDAELSDNSLPS